MANNEPTLPGEGTHEDDQNAAPKRKRAVAKRRSRFGAWMAEGFGHQTAPVDVSQEQPAKAEPTPPTELEPSTPAPTEAAESIEPAATELAETERTGVDSSDADPAADAPAGDSSASEEAAEAPSALPAASTSPFALLFHAPDLSQLPPLPPVRSDEDDVQSNKVSKRSRQRARIADADRQPTTEPQRVKGSTRLEAKRQRRREGRDAGRRRTVVTETEFLARREAVERQMIVRSKHDRVQLAVLEDGVLVEHYVAKSAESSLIGNVYLGRVQNVLPSMEAAFVDIGKSRNAVLYSGEVDWDAADLDGQPRKIELALKPGDTVLVQVTKDPVGHKGARLTSQISLPGRYLVSVPGGSMSGISRKLPDTERARLKKILKQVLPDDMGVIVRTAAEGATEEQLTRDVERLKRQWARIESLRDSSKAPQRLHAEPDLLVKIVRDVFNEDFTSLVIQGSEALSTIREYLESIAPDLLDRVEAYEASDDPFSHYRIAEQIDKALDRKVWLPSGGSLVIDRTEAMTVVDVNTGRFVGAGGNLEETVTKNNLEAAEEIVRQLRLRDIGGIIVIDFIDMVLESNRDLVQRRLIECLSRDRTKHQVAEVTSLGLVQMTRKKLGLGLLESFSEPCETCAGRGIIVYHEPVTKTQRVADEGGGSRRRGGRGGKNGDRQHQTQQQNNGTHAITDDLRKGLSQIALAGRGKSDEESPGVGPEEVAATASDASATEPSAEEQPAEPSPGDEPGAEETGVVTILDIPVQSSGQQQTPRATVDELDGLLGGALDALKTPEPGTGKAARRSRRASSGIISTRPEE